MGKISNTHRDQQAMYEVPHRYDFSAIEVNIAAEGGSSGAPLVDKECEVVGMLHGGRTEGQSMNYFVSSREINNILGKKILI
jgi:V8-like Glu-specific endopeptidase